MDKVHARATNCTYRFDQLDRFDWSGFFNYGTYPDDFTIEVSVLKKTVKSSLWAVLLFETDLACIVVLTPDGDIGSLKCISISLESTVANPLVSQREVQRTVLMTLYITVPQHWSINKADVVYEDHNEL